MGYTQDQYDKLVAALASGAKFVKYSDKEVEYRSIAEMQALKREMEIALGIIRCASRKSYAVYDKGLSDVRRAPRGRHAPVSGTSTQIKGDTFKVFIKTEPGDDVITLRSGVEIPKEYAPGSMLVIPYLKSGGVWVETPFYVNGMVRDDIDYVQGSGEIVAVFVDGDYVTIKYEYNG